MPEEPLVVRVMREHKRALLAQEQLQYRNMAARWLEVERSLEAQISQLARELADARDAGKSVNVRSVYQMARYQELVPQVRRELERYGVYAADEIAVAQGRYAQQGLFDAAEAIGTSFRETGRLGVFYHRLPVSAVENMVGLAGDGSPVKALLKASWPDTVDALTSALIQGTAAGWNPTRTAAAMRDSMASTGLGRAITIARTEQLRAYRQAADMQYRASGVVQYKMRVVSHQAGQTCLACLALEGEIIPIDEDLYDHPRGRCSEIPIPIGTQPPQWVKGEEWFNGLPPDTQREMMGAGRYEAWRAGRFSFKEIAGITDDKTWGKSPRVKSLKEIGGVGGATTAAQVAIKTPTVIPTFKTTKEAEEWLRTNFVDRVNLPGITVEQAQPIAQAFEDVLGEFGIRIHDLEYVPSTKRRVSGQFVRVDADTPGERRSIQFGKDYMRHPKKHAEETRITFGMSRALNIGELERKASDLKRIEPLREAARKKLEHWQLSKRWSVSSTANDPLFATASHEAGHALYYHDAFIKMDWEAALARYNTSGWQRVSEYASSANTELFAEVTSLVADGRSVEVPTEIMAAYRETLDAARKRRGL